MLSYIWPVALIIISNIIYQVCAKSVPEHMDPFASLTVTYIVGALISAVLYCVTNKSVHIIREYTKLNWAPFVLGLIIVGLEAGYIFAYKKGWPVSTTATVQSAFLAVALIVLGFVAYHEKITWNKAVGVAMCLAGLVFINYK